MVIVSNTLKVDDDNGVVIVMLGEVVSVSFLQEDPKIPPIMNINIKDLALMNLQRYSRPKAYSTDQQLFKSVPDNFI